MLIVKTVDMYSVSQIKKTVAVMSFNYMTTNMMTDI